MSRSAATRRERWEQRSVRLDAPTALLGFPLLCDSPPPMFVRSSRARGCKQEEGTVVLRRRVARRVRQARSIAHNGWSASARGAEVTEHGERMRRSRSLYLSI